LAWAAGDSQARGFLIGATAGRTTLNGEACSIKMAIVHLLASTIPNCVSYDATYSYELAVIVHEGMRRMYQERRICVFLTLTTMNENYTHPEMPKGSEEGHYQRDVLVEDGGTKEYKVTKAINDDRVRLLGSGTILREVRAAAKVIAVMNTKWLSMCGA